MLLKQKFQDFFKKKGMTQNEIGKAIGMSSHMVGKMLYRPNYPFLKKISELFPDIDLNYILKDEPELSALNDREIEYGIDKNEELLDKIEEAIKKLRENLAQK